VTDLREHALRRGETDCKTENRLKAKKKSHEGQRRQHEHTQGRTGGDRKPYEDDEGGAQHKRKSPLQDWFKTILRDRFGKGDKHKLV